MQWPFLGTSQAAKEMLCPRSASCPGLQQGTAVPQGAIHQHVPVTSLQPALWEEEEAAPKPNPSIAASSPSPEWQRAEKRQQLHNQPQGLC